VRVGARVAAVVGGLHTFRRAPEYRKTPVVYNTQESLCLPVHISCVVWSKRTAAITVY